MGFDVTSTSRNQHSLMFVIKAKKLLFSSIIVAHIVNTAIIEQAANLMQWHWSENIDS